jgi:hypothetical protein
LSDNYLVWVCEKYIGSIFVSSKLNKLKEDNSGNELMVNASKPAHLMCYLPTGKLIIASDGMKLHMY